MSRIASCADFEKRLNAFLDGELEGAARAEMEAHAKDCAGCAEKLESMKSLKAILDALDEDLTVPLDAQAAWRRAIRAEAAKAPTGKRSRALWRSFGAVAAALAVLICGTAVYRLRGGLPTSGAAVNPSVLLEGGVAKSAARTGYYDGGSAAVEANMLSLASDGAMEDSYESTASADTAAGGESAARQQIILRSASRKIETTAFDQSMQSAEDLVGEYEGWFEDLSVSGRKAENGETPSRVASMTARVPAAQLDDFLSSLDALGTVTSASQASRDVSDQYYDTDSRLDTLRAQLKRLNELTASAQNMEDLIALDEKAGYVQEQIDSLEGSLRNLNSRASMSEVSIRLTEVAVRDKVQPIAESLSERVRNAFFDSVNWLGGFVEDSAVVAAILAPLLIILVPLVLVLWLIVRGVKRARRKKRGL